MNEAVPVLRGLALTTNPTEPMCRDISVSGIVHYGSKTRLIHCSGSARVFEYTVYRGFLNRVYGILQLKYGYSVYHFL